jgi:hypothetical protein
MRTVLLAVLWLGFIAVFFYDYKTHQPLIGGIKNIWLMIAIVVVYYTVRFVTKPKTSRPVSKLD